MTKILITGCAGFIGSHLAERLLDKGHTVIGIDNFDPFYDRVVKEGNLSHFAEHDNFEFYEIDIANKRSLKALPVPDVVIHLAAKAGVLPSLKDPAGYINANIVGTNNLLEFMKGNEVGKLVFASSSSVYGNTPEMPFKETGFVDRPISPYAFTKRSCELMNYNYHHLYNFDILNLRLFTVYGPRQRPDLAIHKFINLIRQGKPIDMYGDGSTSRDYTFVFDTVTGLEAALEYVMNNERVYEIVNLGNNHPVKLIDLINTIYELMNEKPNINPMPMQPGDVDITYADISKAQKLLGYNPSTTIKEGLSSFIKWFNERKQKQSKRPLPLL